MKRSLSHSGYGVVPVSIYTKPAGCGGNCIFCPDAKGIPKSYTFNEDTRLALQLKFHSGQQFMARWELLAPSLRRSRLPFEVIVLGGSFSAHSKEYRRSFVENLLGAMAQVGRSSSDECMTALCSVLTVESRPDQINQDECVFLRSIGVSKVEIGVQHTDDRVLTTVRRGHSQSDVQTATKLLKSNGFKVGYHVMIGLPGASLERDSQMLGETLWKNEYSPDYLKVYPCALLKDVTLQPELFKLWCNKSWRAPDEFYCQQALDVLSQNIPKYVRLSRIQRQFDLEESLDAPRPGLRTRMRSHLVDLRSRELHKDELVLASEADLILEIIVSGNDFIFELTQQYTKRLVSIARCFRSGEVAGEAVVRELKVFGLASAVGAVGASQGRGIGTRLLAEVENYFRGIGCKELLINAAPGAKSFFFKHGYVKREDHFLTRNLVGCAYLCGARAGF